MKRRRWGLLAACLCVLAAMGALASKMMNVQVRDGQVRATPSFLGQIVGRASYGQPVDVLEENGDWRKVSVGAVTGWMHVSALTTEKLALQGGSGNAAGVSGKEMALAGKGFNAQVENEYRNSHGGDYATVDAMEKYVYQPDKLMAFLAAGDVRPEGGVQ